MIDYVRALIDLITEIDTRDSARNFGWGVITVLAILAVAIITVAFHAEGILLAVKQ